MKLTSREEVKRAWNDGTFKDLDWTREATMWEDRELQVIHDGVKRLEPINVPEAVWQGDPYLDRYGRLVAARLGHRID